MGKYISNFQTTEEFNTFKLTSGYSTPHVTLLKDTGLVIFDPIINNTPEHNYSLDYLTFISLADNNTFNFDKYDEIEYSLDNGETWLQDTSVTVNNGDSILWRGELTSTDYGIGLFYSSDSFNVQGNIMSLLFGDNFIGQTDLSDYESTFYGLFRETYIVSAEHLILPATTLAINCYMSMFANSNLTTAPTLPATTLADYCYNCMFEGCTSLTAAPELPATTLASGCYNGMFQGCTSLITAPELPAATLTDHCYISMFEGCTSLTTAPELPATTLADSCYISMFEGCTSLTAAPELPATTLADLCYYLMFSGCTNLNSITCLATNISANYCTYYWLNDVATTGTFIKTASMNSWIENSKSGIPSGWTVQNAS